MSMDSTGIVPTLPTVPTRVTPTARQDDQAGRRRRRTPPETTDTETEDDSPARPADSRIDEYA